ncbi:MAG: calcium-binding protein, partial [Burkholderiales bacterium]
MTQASVYALLSANSYDDIRPQDRNRAPLPAGWTVLTQYDVSGSGANANVTGSGFSARVYQGPGGEVVIAYAGTEFGGSVAGLIADFASGNVPLALGLYGEQAYQAALLYQQVKAQLGPNITFTGHSLGGGLAGLMGVWFNRPATVFAPAPFEPSAKEVSASDLIDRVKNQLATQGHVDPAFDNYRYGTDFATREAKIASYAVNGEVLSSALSFMGFIQQDPSHKLYASASWGLTYMLDKHSVDLHAAALLVPSFDASASKLAQALPLLFDDKLYGYAVTGTQQNLLVKLIRGEVGVRDESNGQVVAAPNALLTHFSNDLGKLDAVGLAKLSQAGQQAVLAQNMEWYYWQGGAYAGSEFATVAGSLLQYNSAEGDGLLTDVSRAQPWVKTWLDAVWADNGNSDYPSFGTRFQQWSLSTEQAVVASARNADMTQIFVGAASGDQFTGGNLADVLLGGDGADTLDGAGGRDVLVGGAGNDSLVGGSGNDELRGGEGSDAYAFTGTFGQDVVIDSGGSGSITLDGRPINGSTTEKVKDGVYQDADFTYVVVDNGHGALELLLQRRGAQDSILIRDWASGRLGIPSSTPNRCFGPFSAIELN